MKKIKKSIVSIYVLVVHETLYNLRHRLDRPFKLLDGVIQKEGIDSEDKEGITLLRAAAYEREGGVVAYLLERRADITLNDRYGDSAVIHAASSVMEKGFRLGEAIGGKDPFAVIYKGFRLEEGFRLREAIGGKNPFAVMCKFVYEEGDEKLITWMGGELLKIQREELEQTKKDIDLLEKGTWYDCMNDLPF